MMTKHIKHNLTKFYLCLFLSIFSINGYSWGESEQDILKGFLGGMVIKHLYESHKNHKSQHSNLGESDFYISEEDELDVYSGNIHPPHECRNNPYVNNKNAKESWLRGCMLRYKEKMKLMEKEAFESGYRGY